MQGPRILAGDRDGLGRAAAILRSGGLVAVPTESSFGIAASIDAPSALERILRIKQRPPSSPFPVLVSDLDQAEKLLGSLTGAAKKLTLAHWPGPLTIVSPPVRPVHDSLVSDMGMGVRVPGLALLRRLVALTGGPITATSANISGRAPAMTAGQAAELVGIDAVIDAPTGGGVPSTVAAVRAWGLEVLRKGPVDVPARLEVTRDTIFKGAVTIFQPRKGYRFSLDALLLAAFASRIVKCGRKLLATDLGTGCGVVAMALSYWLTKQPGPACRDLRIYGVELQARLADLARLAVEAAGVQGQVSIVQADLRDKTSSLPTGRCDLVLCNPPYRRQGTGRSSSDQERELALSEQGARIEEVTRAASRLLKPGGRAAFVFPARRTADLFSAAFAAGLRPSVLRPVLPHHGQPARRVLLAADKARPAAPLVIEPPLILHEEDGRDTAPLSAILEGGDA